MRRASWCSTRSPRPSVEVYVVVSGRVELWNDPARLGEPPDEVLGPGGLFGFSAMLTERSIGPRAVAAVPSTVARIPEAAALPVFTSRLGARFLAGRLAAIPVRPEIGPTYSTVDELVRTAPLVVPPDDDGRRGGPVDDRRRRPLRGRGPAGHRPTAWSPMPACAGTSSSTAYPGQPRCVR